MSEESEVYLVADKSKLEQFNELLRQSMHGDYTVDMFTVSAPQAYWDEELGTNTRCLLTPKANTGIKPQYVHYNRIELSNIELTTLSYSIDDLPNVNVLADVINLYLEIGIPASSIDVDLSELEGEVEPGYLWAYVNAKPNSYLLVESGGIPIEVMDVQ